MFKQICFEVGFESVQGLNISDIRWGAEQLKALDPMVVRRAGGTVWLIEEEDLRDLLGVWMWRRSVRYRGVRLWMALNVSSRVLNWMRYCVGSQWS